MKRGTPRHKKMYVLAGALKIALPHAAGIMEMLWHFAAQYAPEGDIGSFPDQEIASAVGWEKKPALLIEALLESGWIHAHEQHRLYVHDWPDHCEQSVDRLLKRNRKTFLEVYSQRLARDESVTSQRLDSREERQGMARHGSEVFTKENQDAPIPPEPAPTDLSRIPAVAFPPQNSQSAPSDAEFRRILKAFTDCGVLLSEPQAREAAVEWVSMTDSQRLGAPSAAEERARHHEPRWMGLPAPWLRKREWMAIGTGRTLPEPPGRAQLAQEGAEKSFLARKRAEGR